MILVKNEAKKLNKSKLKKQKKPFEMGIVSGKGVCLGACIEPPRNLNKQMKSRMNKGFARKRVSLFVLKPQNQNRSSFNMRFLTYFFLKFFFEKRRT